MDSARLHAFVAVAREGGFSKAARQLGRTQSSVSEGISLLEEDLGHRLFQRDARATTLTAEGRLLLEHAERILDEMQAVRARLEAAGGEPHGELTVGTTDTLACYLLPPVFAALRTQHPAVQLRLENRPSPGIAVEVAERRLSVGVLSLPLPDLKSGGRPVAERLKIEPLVALEEVVICPPGHPLASRRRVTIAQLVEQPLLLLDRSTGTRALLDRAFGALGRKPEVVMETRSVDVLKRLVQLGFGVSVVPSISVNRQADAGNLVVRPLHGLGVERWVGVAMPLGGHPPPAAQAFAALAIKHLGRRK